MSINKADTNTNEKSEIMISDLLSAISETEYPQYVLEAIENS